MQSNVRSIESLAALRQAIGCLSAELDLAVQEIGGGIEAARTWIHSERPVYWKQQTELAERRLTEALEQWSQAQSGSDPRNRPAATEAQQRVARARQRLRLCQEKRIACRRQAAELETLLLRLAGPVASVGEHAQRGLPQARAELGELVRILQSYSQQPAASPAPAAAELTELDLTEDRADDRPEGPSA